MTEPELPEIPEVPETDADDVEVIAHGEAPPDQPGCIINSSSALA